MGVKQSLPVIETPKHKLASALPTLLTFGNLAFGFLVIWMALSRRDQFFEDSGKFFTMLGLLLMVACLCDFLDGFVARKLNTTSPLGLELDSLADLVSFGVAPVVVFYVCLFDEKPGVFSFVACLGYILAGAFRLARFNNSASTPGKPNSHFEGLPITGASIFWVALLLFLGRGRGNILFEGHETGMRRFAIFVFAALGLLMISRFPYRSLKTPLNKSRHIKRELVLLGLLGGLVIARFGLETAIILVPILYIFGTPLVNFWKKLHPKENKDLDFLKRPE